MAIKIRIANRFKEELNGRLLLFIDRPGAHEEKMLYKRNGFGSERSPVFGVTFYGLKGGDEIDLDLLKDKIFGSPLQYEQIPAERLQFQAFFIRWHKFKRKDGHEIWGMADYGGGGNYALNPFNLYSDVKTIDYGKRDVELVINHEIKPGYELRKGQVYQQGNYRNHGLVRYFKMKSSLVGFLGRRHLHWCQRPASCPL